MIGGGVVSILVIDSCVNLFASFASFATSFYPSYGSKNTTMVPAVLNRYIFNPI